MEAHQLDVIQSAPVVCWEWLGRHTGQEPDVELWRASDERWEGSTLLLDLLKESEISRRQSCPHLLKHTTGDVQDEQPHVLAKLYGVHSVPPIIV